MYVHTYMLFIAMVKNKDVRKSLHGSETSLSASLSVTRLVGLRNVPLPGSYRNIGYKCVLHQG